MTKITISRIMELSKALTTQAGQQLADPLTYLSEFAEVALRNLRNGLTFADNLDCEIRQVRLVHDVETVISIAASTKRATRITIDQIIDPAYYVADAFGWKYNSQGQIVVKIKYAGTPSPTLALPVTLVVHF